MGNLIISAGGDIQLILMIIKRMGEQFFIMSHIFVNVSMRIFRYTVGKIERRQRGNAVTKPGGAIV